MLLQRGKQIGEVTKRQLGVQSTCDVEFSCAFLHRFTGDAQAIVDVVGVGVRLARRAIKAAKLAVGVTNVRWVEVTIYVEIRGATMLAAGSLRKGIKRWRQNPQ